MSMAVYVLCALTSAACAWLLFRSFLTKRARFLMYSALCFSGLAINNIILFVDGVVLPNVDLAAWRMGGIAVALAGFLALLYALVSDAY